MKSGTKPITPDNKQAIVNQLALSTEGIEVKFSINSGKKITEVNKKALAESSEAKDHNIGLCEEID